MAQFEFELIYYDVAVQYISNNAMEISLLKKGNQIFLHNN